MRPQAKLTTLLLVGALAFGAVPMPTAHAQFGGGATGGGGAGGGFPSIGAGFKPFGGPILAITVCFVPAAGLLLEIGPPRDGDFLFIPGVSRLFLFRSIRVGAQTLGLAGPNLLGCFIRVSVRRGFILQLVGEGNPIIMMGTSL